MGDSKMTKILLILVGLFTSQMAIADDIDLGGATLEDLLNVKTSVATKKESSVRATPGILSIITEEEIKNLGARDLIDVLRLIPSISFGNDVQGVVGIGNRGMWGHEGKILLIVDGVEMNEIQYGSTQFGNEFPVNHIKRIEVIRGPGSVTYGGFAELAVVNITTKRGSDLKGGAVDVTYGKMAEEAQRQNVGLQIGRTSGSWDYSVAGYAGKAFRGEGVYTGYSPDIPAVGSFDYKDADELNPTYANLGLRNENFKFRFIYNNYQITTRSMFYFNDLTTDIPNTFRTYGTVASYDLKLSEKFKITPQIQHSYQIPWLQDSEEALTAFKWSNIHSERLRAGVTASYDPTESINYLVGYEFTEDKHRIVDQRRSAAPTVPDPFNTGSNSARFGSSAFLAQGIFQMPIFDVTIGARYEDPDFTDSSFVPRLGLTRAEKDWHAKLLYAQAFRTPVLFNIDAKADIQPEKTETAELEFGHSVSSNSYVTANIFNTKIKDPIVYFFDTDDRYDNFGETGTRGIELDYRLRPTWGQVQLAYSFYQVNNSDVAKYEVAGEEDMLVGMPQHRVVLNSWLNLGSRLTRLNANYLYNSDAWAYEYDYGLGDMALRKSGPTNLVNLFLTREQLFLNGLSGGVGVFNIFNQDVRYIQPYEGGHSPAPGPSREVVVRLEYKSNF